MKALLFLSILVLCITDQLYTKQTPGHPDALCLDGSPSILYTHQGTEKNKFIIYFFGGGLCAQKNISATLQSCYQRSSTILGTSTLWPENLAGEGYLSTNPNLNPYYNNYTKILFPYCDGSLHQGFRNQPINYKNKNLYFRGNRIVKQHFDWLNTTFNLFNAEKVILTGGSAGGIATFIWANYLKSLVKTQNMKIVIDSGVFLNQPNHITKQYDVQQMLKTLVSLVNVEQKTPFQQCNSFYPNQLWKCLFIQYNFAALIPPSLIVNSQYDAWVIPNTLNVKCAKGFDLSKCTKNQMTVIENYRKQFLKFIALYLTVPKNNVWTISCVGHVYMSSDLIYNTPLFRIPQGSQGSTQYSLVKFDNNQRVEMIDVLPWPDNIPCAKI